MKKIPKSSILLYNLTQFNAKRAVYSQRFIRARVSISLLQKEMTKKNMLNFIFFLFLVSDLKPRLQTASDGNAVLKIRRGSLIETYVDVDNFEDIEKLFILGGNGNTPFHKLSAKLPKNKAKRIFSLSEAIKIIPSSYTFRLMLGVEAFNVVITIQFAVECKTHRRFILSQY